MIGFLRGVLRDKQPPSLLIEVQGVGYEIEAPMTTFYDLPAPGETVTLFTHLAVREDAHTLYGFSKRSDRKLFRALIKVNGVGARLALTILSGMDASRFAHCVQAGDTASLVKLPGVGKKTAERLVVEMRDRLADWELPAAGPPGNSAAKYTCYRIPIEKMHTDNLAGIFDHRYIHEKLLMPVRVLVDVPYFENQLSLYERRQLFDLPLGFELELFPRCNLFSRGDHDYIAVLAH